MPRPKKTDKQTKQLPATRCTETEYKYICENSKKAGLSISAYVRKCAMGQKIVIKQSKWDTELVFQLRKLAVNLNQQTRWLNRTGKISGELTQLWKKINRLMDQIIEE